MSEITAYISQVRRSLYGGPMIAKPRLKRSSHCGNISKRFPLRGPVAQGIEQRFPGPCVAGSNPARPASLRGFRAHFARILPGVSTPKLRHQGTRSEAAGGYVPPAGDRRPDAGSETPSEEPPSVSEKAPETGPVRSPVCP